MHTLPLSLHPGCWRSPWWLSMENFEKRQNCTRPLTSLTCRQIDKVPVNRIHNEGYMLVIITCFCWGCFIGCVVFFISLPSAIGVTERTGSGTSEATFGLLLLFSKCSSSLHAGGGGGQSCHYNRYNHTHGRHQLFAMGM